MNAILRVIPLQQRLVAAHSHIRGDVARLGLTHERVEQQAIDDLQRGLLNVLMRAMDGVTGLESDDCAPMSLCERCAGLRRVLAVGAELLLQILALDDRDGAADQHVVLAIHGRDARVRLFGGAENVLRLNLLIVGVDLIHRQDAQMSAGLIHQHHFLALLQSTRGICGGGQGDGQAPDRSVRQPHLAHRAFVVGLVHEPC